MYISNQEFLNNMGIRLTGNLKADNDWVNILFFIDSNDDVSIDDFETGEKVTFKRNDYYKGFTNRYWQDLAIAQKLRLLKWAGNDFLISLGHPFDNVISFKFLYKDLDCESNTLGSSSSDGFIYLNFEYVDCANGFEVLNTIFHETVHFNDKYNSKYLFLRYYKYLPEVRNVKELTEATLALPISGKIKNFDTKKTEMITEKMREEILLLKNSLISINYTKVNSTSENAEYLDMLRKFSYLYSPLERRARDLARERTLNVFSKVYNRPNQDDQDDRFACTGLNSEKFFHSYFYEDIYNLFQCDLDELINLFLVNEYNAENFNDIHNFICKDYTNKLDDYLKKGWKNFKKTINKGEENNEKTDSRDML